MTLKDFFSRIIFYSEKKKKKTRNNFFSKHTQEGPWVRGCICLSSLSPCGFVSNKGNRVMAQKIMVCVCVWKEGVQKLKGVVGEGTDEISTGNSTGGRPFHKFLVDQTTVDTFFAHQQD